MGNAQSNYIGEQMLAVLQATTDIVQSSENDNNGECATIQVTSVTCADGCRCDNNVINVSNDAHQVCQISAKFESEYLSTASEKLDSAIQLLFSQKSASEQDFLAAALSAQIQGGKLTGGTYLTMLTHVDEQVKNSCQANALISNRGEVVLCGNNNRVNASNVATQDIVAGCIAGTFFDADTTQDGTSTAFFDGDQALLSKQKGAAAILFALVALALVVVVLVFFAGKALLSAPPGGGDSFADKAFKVAPFLV